MKISPEQHNRLVDLEAHGKTTKQIARALNLSPKFVESYVDQAIPDRWSDDQLVEPFVIYAARRRQERSAANLSKIR